jgi:hypothetical protein
LLVAEGSNSGGNELSTAVFGGVGPKPGGEVGGYGNSFGGCNGKHIREAKVMRSYKSPTRESMLPTESFLKTLRPRFCCGSALADPGCAGGRAARD